MTSRNIFINKCRGGESGGGGKAIRNPIWNYVPSTPISSPFLEEGGWKGGGKDGAESICESTRRFKGDLFYANLIYYLKAYDTGIGWVAVG